MKTGTLRVAWAVAFLGVATCMADGNDDVRNAIEQVAGLNPCNGTLASGWSPVKALRARGVQECDWVAEAAKMADEEMARWTENDSTDQSNGAPDGRKLRLLAAMLGEARECRDMAMQTTLRMAQEAPEGSGAWSPASGAWILLVCSSDTPERFVELGDWYLANRGPDSAEFTRFCTGLWMQHSACGDAERSLKRAIEKYLIASAEKFQNAYNVAIFDVYAVGDTHFQHYPGLEGWVGSLQRRRLAEKFPNALVKGTNTLASRAAAELAADEKDLTDLREVYGAWEEEGEE